MISTFDRFLNGGGQAECDTDLPLRICRIERCEFIGFLDSSNSSVLECWVPVAGFSVVWFHGQRFVHQLYFN